MGGKQFVGVSILFFAITLVGYCMYGYKDFGGIQVARSYIKSAHLTLSRLYPGMHKCSLDYFREQTIQNELFPSYKSCQWQNNTVNISNCFHDRNISKVAILGDSNGGMFAKALVTLIQQDSGGCVLHKSEIGLNNFFPEPSYYLGADPHNVTVTHKRDCYGCNSAVYRCTRGSRQVDVEYISMEFTMDTEISTFRIHRKYNFPTCGTDGFPDNKRPCPQSHTTQEFVLKEYFPLTGYPDLIFYFSGAHDHVVFTSSEMKNAASFLGGLFSLHVPSTSKVVFFGKLFEEMTHKPKKWQTMIYEDKYNLFEQIQRLNNATIKGLKPHLEVANSNIYTFFDLFAFGGEHGEEWAVDGVHKQLGFYSTVWSYFTRSFCHSD